MSSFYDSRISKDGSAKIVRCQNWLELVLDWEPQGKTLMFKTDNKEEAKRAAVYSFHMSPDSMVTCW